MGAVRAFGHHIVTRRQMDKRVTVWLAMRQLVRFDIPTLVMTTEAAQRTVQDFVYRVAVAGYVRKQRVKGAKVAYVWQLVRDTGPLPPITRRSRGYVYDQNERKCYAPGGRIVECEREDRADAA